MSDDEPKAKPPRVTQHRLDAWDVDDLRDYIAELQGEISRAEAAVARKTSHRQAAEAFFRAGS